MLLVRASCLFGDHGMPMRCMQVIGFTDCPLQDHASGACSLPLGDQGMPVRRGQALSRWPPRPLMAA